MLPAKKSVSVNPPIIFEDESLLVIDKPYGVVVNKSDTTAKVFTVQDFAEGKVLKVPGAEEFNDRGGIVHRLDKDTSGVLVIAKTPEAFENLKNQFKGRKTVKKYLALVHGKVEPLVGKIDAPIERSPFNRMHFGIFPGGREAVTSYKLISNFKFLMSNYSLLEVEPKTGRTHQIRVHMKYIGHPIVSDPIYGGRKQLREDLKWCPRLFLHAASLEIAHPETGKKLEFGARLPEDLEKVLRLFLVV